ncbi:nicastrin-like [Chiloscyllium punctatum]|uniref:nicastrin-like n=1 Tax=Chiloscyllium punctatum TaxID=137246 RepID=UPI003B63B239
MFLFFQGETFDYIGSSKVVYDMKNGNFPIRLGNIDAYLEMNQVGQADSIWAHTDPVSRQNSSIEGGVQSLLKSLSAATSGTNVTLQEPDHSQPLPPSSFHRFLREQSIPGVVLTDHQAAFTNRSVPSPPWRCAQSSAVTEEVPSSPLPSPPPSISCASRSSSESDRGLSLARCILGGNAAIVVSSNPQGHLDVQDLMATAGCLGTHSIHGSEVQ